MRRGLSGGGTITLGGGAHGSGSLLQAQTLSIDGATTLRADALGSGDGGTISGWSLGQTAFLGSLSARGGATAGNGGSAEMSSANTLTFAGLVDLTAPAGRVGSVLLDPTSVTIIAGGGAVGSSTIDPAALQAALASAAVTVTTSAGGTGDITVSSPVSWTSGNALTLSAYHSVILNTTASVALTAGNGANITLQADNAATGAGTVTFGAGVTVSTGGKLSILYNPSSYATPTSYTANLTGGGTLTASMLVNSAGQLAQISTNLSGSYALNTNIDMSSIANWTPIGATSAFTGTLDGQGYTVSNMTMPTPSTSASGIGLFGVLQNATVKNLAIATAQIGSGQTSGYSSPIGLLAGSATGGTITNVSVQGAITMDSPGFLGGGIGKSSATISGLASSVSIHAPNSRAGGAIGEVLGGSITLSYATGNVFASSPGGFISAIDATATVTQSFATGNLTAGSGDAGGFAADVGFGTITDSYATGQVTGGNYTASFMGYSIATLARDYGSGRVSNSPHAAAFVASLGGSVSNSYYDSTVNGGLYVANTSSSVGGINGLTTAQFQSSLPSGFSSSVWALTTGGHPHLIANAPPASQVISGVAYSSTGSVLSGATVSVFADGWAEGSAVTAANGAYSITIRGNAVPANVGELTYFSDGSHVGNALSVMGTGGTITSQAVTNGWLTLDPSVSTMSKASTLLSAVRGGVTSSNFITSTGSLYALMPTAASFSIDAPVTASGTLELSSAGTVTQTGAGVITANALAVVGTGTFQLASAANAVGTLAANVGSLSFSQSGSLTIGSVSIVGGTQAGITTPAPLSVASGGSLTISSPITETLASGVTGTLSLVAANDISLTSNITGSGAGTVNVLLSAAKSGTEGAITASGGQTITATGSVTLGGGTLGDGSGYTLGPSTGIYLDGGTTIVAGGAVTLRGQSSATGSNNYGILAGTVGITGNTVAILGSLPNVPSTAQSRALELGYNNDRTAITATTGTVTVSAINGNGIANSNGNTSTWIRNGTTFSAPNGSVLITAVTSSTTDYPLYFDAGVTISASGTVSISGTGINPAYPFITYATIGGSGLTTPASVQISSGLVSLSVGGSITAANTVSITSGASLTVTAPIVDTVATGSTGSVSLVAANDITLQSNITGSGGTANVLLSAAQSGTEGSITANSGQTITTTGSVTLGGGTAGERQWLRDWHAKRHLPRWRYYHQCDGRRHTSWTVQRSHHE